MEAAGFGVFGAKYPTQDKDANYLIYRRRYETRRPAGAPSRFRSNVDQEGVFGEGDEDETSSPMAQPTERSLRNSSSYVDFGDCADFGATEHDNDTVMSGESVFKLFTFEPSRYGSNAAEKCVAFWKEVASLSKDLKPVKCTLVPPPPPSPQAGGGAQEEAQGPGDAEVDVAGARGRRRSISRKSKSKPKPKQSYVIPSVEVVVEHPWYEAFLELRTKNLDRLAMAANPQRCRLCRHDDFRREETGEVPEDDLRHLNTWTPAYKDGTEKATAAQRFSSLAAAPEDVQRQQKDADEGEAPATAMASDELTGDDGVGEFKVTPVSSTAASSEAAPTPCDYDAGDMADADSWDSQHSDAAVEEDAQGGREEIDQASAESEPQEMRAAEVKPTEADSNLGRLYYLTTEMATQTAVPPKPPRMTFCPICGLAHCECAKEALERARREEAPRASQDTARHAEEAMDVAKKVVEYVLYDYDDDGEDRRPSKSLDDLAEKVYRRHGDVFDSKTGQVNLRGLERYARDFAREAYDSEAPAGAPDEDGGDHFYSTPSLDEIGDECRVATTMLLVEELQITKKGAQTEAERLDVGEDESWVREIRRNIRVYRPEATAPKKRNRGSRRKL